MAINIHIARVNFVAVDGSGQFLDKNADTDNPATLGEMLNFSNQHRVMEDAGIANTANYPTVPAYLEAEARDNYVVHYLDQNMIVTYEHADGPLP
jgi:hypothetical protein